MESGITQLKDIYFNTFSSCKSNFKECSIDSINNVYLVSSIKECINYDLLKRILFFCRDSICSADSLAFDEIKNEILFIEFKDSKFKSCKKNTVQAGQDSFLINRLVISLLGNNIMNHISRKYVLVLDETKNSNKLAGYYAAKRSNSLDGDDMYKFLKEKLVDYEYYGHKLFSEIEISSNIRFDDIVKNI